MKNKLIALAIITFSALLTVFPQVSANSEAILNRYKAVELVIKNSTAVWDAREQISLSKNSYTKQLDRSKNIDTEKTSFRNPFTGKQEYYYYEPPVQMQLRLLKEFVPEQLKYVWQVRQKALTVTENTMANLADDLFIGLYSAYQNRVLAQKSLDLAKRVLEREKVRYQNGLITSLDLEGYQLDVETYQNAIIKADREYENMHRQFNALAGLPVDYLYDLVGAPYVASNIITVSEEEAVASALQNRMEIWDLNYQIDLIQKKIEIYQHKDVHTYHQQTKEDYGKALDELEDLKLKLSQAEYSIEKEIRKAYQELKSCYLDLELSKLHLKQHKHRLATISIQFENGLVPFSVVEQLENAIYQLEYAVSMNTILTLNKKDRFYRAISVGPGY